MLLLVGMLNCYRLGKLPGKLRFDLLPVAGAAIVAAEGVQSAIGGSLWKLGALWIIMQGRLADRTKRHPMSGRLSARMHRRLYGQNGDAEGGPKTDARKLKVTPK